jgi:hypothetical protein
MKRKFTQEYLDSIVNEIIRTYPSCEIIQKRYGGYLNAYQKMLKHQFNLNQWSTLHASFPNDSHEEITLLRVLLLQAFETAILNGEIK